MHPFEKEPRIPNYKYNINQIYISVRCFLESSASFRALESIFEIIQEKISSLATPAYTTIRQWLFKLGLYKLNRPKNNQQKWFYIIDASIQMGTQKCVAVIGIPQVDIGQNFSPSFKDAEPLVIRPLHSSPGEVIQDIIEEATQKTGTPLAVVSDEGGDIKKGVRLFSEKHPETIHLFDISHKLDNCLKKELESDCCWTAFKKSASYSLQVLKLSSISHLCPPRERSKGRMHNAFHLIQWGVNALNYLRDENSLSSEERGKIVWLEGYQFVFPIYFSFMNICKEALALVHEKGYYKGLADEFSIRTQFMCRENQRLTVFQKKVKNILELEEQKVPEGEHYLGTSEIIESLFGKFKYMEGPHSYSGITSMVLGIPALLGTLNETVIENALSTVQVDDVILWLKENLGPTYRSKRHGSLGRNKNSADRNLELCDI